MTLNASKLKFPSSKQQNPPPALAQTEEEYSITRLLLHLPMNATADYYDIQSLVGFTNSKMQPLLTNCPTKFLPHLLQEVPASTGDANVQSNIASTAANRIEDLIELPDFSQMDLGSDVLMKIVNACGLRVR
ncbi:hypothetical protein FOCG_17324 [Fusarium oxysporum f. sp. radicis-lycopersici 26381]|nr:hypothetical protein FOCG_17324 [Fusarium oxysporum f. sp. radicis-lycopersici 26381]